MSLDVVTYCWCDVDGRFFRIKLGSNVCGSDSRWIIRVQHDLAMHTILKLIRMLYR